MSAKLIMVQGRQDDQVVLFRDGQIDQAGTPQELYGSPRTEFAARFMANVPLLAGVLDSSGSGYVIRHEAGAVPVSVDSVQAQGLGTGAACAAVLRSEYLGPSPAGQDSRAESAASRLLIGRGTVSDVIYAGARERLSIHLDNGIDLDYYYDSIDGIAWHRGDRLAISVRSDKVPPVVARHAGAHSQRMNVDADQDAGPARAESSPSGRLRLDERTKVQVR